MSGLISATASCARRTSSRVEPPVDMIIGLPICATYLSSGVLIRSADAILYAGMSSSARKSALGLSNAVAKKVMPISSA